MQIFIGSDHSGYELKERLKRRLIDRFIINDCGAYDCESCDYPEFAEKVGEKVLSNSGSIGILCCGTGIGMAIAANKVPRIRAAVVWNDFSAKMAKEHNNANIICLGARAISEEAALKAIDAFLGCEFDGKSAEGARHRKRLQKIAAIEEKYLK